MKNLFLLFITFTLITSCTDKEEEQNSDHIQSSIALSIQNSNGDDLLNPNNPNGIDTSKIKIFYVVDGKKTQYFAPANLDNTKGYFIFEHLNEYRIAIFTDNDDASTKETTFIQWSENDEDKIDVLYEKIESSLFISKVWINGQDLLYDRFVNDDPTFTLIK